MTGVLLLLALVVGAVVHGDEHVLTSGDSLGVVIHRMFSAQLTSTSFRRQLTVAGLLTSIRSQWPMSFGSSAASGSRLPRAAARTDRPRPPREPGRQRASHPPPHGFLVLELGSLEMLDIEQYAPGVLVALSSRPAVPPGTLSCSPPCPQRDTAGMDTAFTRLVGCRVPIQQAPMGSVSTADLAVAVADAGGVGSISALGMPTPALERLVTAIVGRTAGALAVNFLLPDPDPDAVAYAARHVRIIDCFWFDPDPRLIDVAHHEGALVCWQVGSSDEARAAVDAGSDVVVAQGIEAGGHVRGYVPLADLLPQVLAAVDVPVLAAGGIADRASLLRVLDVGAAGARIGTRFVATTEAGAHPSYKRAIVDAGAAATEITGEFADCPLCATNPRARVLRACIDSMHQATQPVVGTMTFGAATVDVTRGSGMPPGVTASGDVEAMAMYAGQGVAGIASIEPAAAVVRTLWPEHHSVAT